METTSTDTRRGQGSRLLAIYVVLLAFIAGELIGFPLQEKLFKPVLDKDPALYVALAMLGVVTWQFWSRQSRTRAWAPRVIAASTVMVLVMSVVIAAIAGEPDLHDSLTEQLVDFGRALIIAWGVALPVVAVLHRWKLGPWQREHLWRQAERVQADRDAAWADEDARRSAFVTKIVNAQLPMLHASIDAKISNAMNAAPASDGDRRRSNPTLVLVGIAALWLTLRSRRR